MNKFLEMYTLPRLNQREIENMNKPITSKEIETVIKNLPLKTPTLLQSFEDPCPVCKLPQGSWTLTLLSIP